MPAKSSRKRSPAKPSTAPKTAIAPAGLGLRPAGLTVKAAVRATLMRARQAQQVAAFIRSHNEKVMHSLKIKQSRSELEKANLENLPDPEVAIDDEEVEL